MHRYHVIVPRLRKGLDGLVAGIQISKRSQGLRLLRNVEGAGKAHLLYKITLNLDSIYLLRLLAARKFNVPVAFVRLKGRCALYLLQYEFSASSILTL
jgi:hypothetical protein